MKGKAMDKENFNESEMLETIKALYDMAEKVSENAYAPFSGFQVGAALLAVSGKIYTGVNIENSSYGATICAERTAFVKAVSEGERDFVAIAVAAPRAGEEALPCGICRQFMYEFSPQIFVITGKSRDELHIRALEDLMPLGFRLEHQER